MIVVILGDVCVYGESGAGEEPHEQHAAGGRGEERARQRVYSSSYQKVRRVGKKLEAMPLENLFCNCYFDFKTNIFSPWL